MTTKTTKPTIADLQAIIAQQNEQIATLLQVVQAQQNVKTPSEVAAAASETTTAAKEMLSGMWKLTRVATRSGRKALGNGLVAVGNKLA